MRRWSLLGWLAAVSLLAAQAHASSALDININNDAAFAGLTWGMGDDNLIGEGQFYYNTEDAYVGSIGLLVIGETGQTDNPVEAGIGAKIIGAYGNTDSSFFGFAVSPGVSLRVYPPEANRLVLGLNVNFAPEVVSFGDAKSLVETSARIEYLLIPQAFAYLGYRRLAVTDDRDDESYVLDSGIHIGVRMLFQ